MTNRPTTTDELIEKWADAWDISKADEDYEAINLIEEFIVDLRDLERSYGQH